VERTDPGEGPGVRTVHKPGERGHLFILEEKKGECKKTKKKKSKRMFVHDSTKHMLMGERKNQKGKGAV